MGAVKLCIHKTAKTPYCAEVTGIHLYSIEELAYYLYHNIYLMDEQTIGESLYSWIEKELEMNALAERLREGKNTGIHIYNQVMTILQASEYYTQEELSMLSEKIKNISGLQTQERLKYKADEMLHNRNYWSAVIEYNRILSIRQSSRLSVEFYAKVWNNLGVCYAKLFLFEKAAACFENAYRFQKIPVYQQAAYYARKLSKDTGEEKEELSERKLSEEFIQEASMRLKALEEQSRAKCKNLDPQNFFKDREHMEL